jgi:pyrroline-5-carboxylate reductase
MGSAIAEGIKADYPVSAFEKDDAKIKGLVGISIASSVEQLLLESAMVILAVKPQELGRLLVQLRGKTAGKIIVSIAAGIPTAAIEERIGGGCRVVRVMPNLPAKIGKGMICLCAGSSASVEDARKTRAVFSYVGKTLVVNEGLMNAVTAVSGSGPGYFYYLIENMDKKEWTNFAVNNFIPALAEAAVAAGFNKDDAGVLASVTAEGSLALLEQAGSSPADLLMRVTSKGGTTEAGIAAMRVTGGSLAEAVKAALKRAEELSGKID